MGCGGGDWVVVQQCWVDLQQTRDRPKQRRERKREKLIKYCIL